MSVFIAAAKRTPIGSLGGSLAALPAPRLGAAAIRATLEQSGLEPGLVDEVFMGNVLSANLGQAPARQAALFGGLPDKVPCTTVNKVCSSGLKSVTLGAQSILTGDNQVVLAGGMESMSNVPHYAFLRQGNKLGHAQLTDGMIRDGLWDVYNDYHMGNAAELCASEYHISREAQDEYAIRSYQRAARAWETGAFREEVVPVEIPSRKGDSLRVDRDEEFTRVDFSRIPGLKPVFVKDGTVTAANASTINDGAAALVLLGEKALREQKLKPLARIVSYADAAQAPEWFTTSPALAIRKAVERSGLAISDIGFWEINEAFAVVVLAAIHDLQLDPEKVNVHGGGVSLGHPIGASGARILVSLLHILEQNKARYGVAGLCNGGGGATAVVVENLGM